MSDPSAPARLSSPSGGTRTTALPSSSLCCPRCGGSGQLRTGHGAYRTCLECAGRGTVTTSRQAA